MIGRPLGKTATCEVCGGRSKILFAIPGVGLYSMCKCGLMRREWAPGGGDGQLRRIAEEYEVSSKFIVEMLKPVKGISRRGEYKRGYRYCSRCMLYYLTESRRCPYCGGPLRSTVRKPNKRRMEVRRIDPREILK